jgi:rhodanese-related sulfurtransferase
MSKKVIAMYTMNRSVVFVLSILLLSGCGTEEQRTDGEKKSGLFVINVLDKEWYDDCHIKGSINVPFAELDSFVKKLDTEKSEIVLYCSNHFCASSMYACKHLKELGFKHVWAYEGGTAEWYQLGLPVEGPSQRAYLTKKVEPDRPAADNESVITAQELAQKLEIKAA